MGGKVLLESVLQMHDGGADAGGARRGAVGGAAVIALREVAGEQFFRGAHGQVAPQDGVGQQRLFLVGFGPEEDFGVPDGDAALGQPALDAGGQFQQAHGVGDGGAAFADFLGNFVLFQAEFLGKALVGDGFFDRVEVLALDVFDEGELEHLLVPGLADDHGGFLQTELLGGAPAAFTGDQFVFVVAFADDQGLDNAVFADRFDQFQETFAAEFGAGLEGAGNDVAGGDFLNPLAGFGLGGGHAGLNEGSETFSEGDFRHKAAIMTLLRRDANGQKRGVHIFVRFGQAVPVIFETIELLVELGGTAHPAAVNMAVDEVLLIGARRPILRVYGWQRPAVTFGYFEQWEPVAAAFPGRDRVRRWTGGGVVPHGEDWTYSLIVPRSEPFARTAAGESYRLIHEWLGEAMRGGGVEARLTPSAAPKISQACFENPAQFDLLAGAHKIAGAAQRRSRFGMLHQGSVQGIAIPPGLAERLAARLARRTEPRPLSAGELAAAEDLALAKYATEAWNTKF